MLHDEVVAIEQLGLVCEHHVVVSRHVNIAFEPRKDAFGMSMVGGRAGRKEIDVVGFDERHDRLLHAGDRLVIGIAHGIDADEHDRTLATLLPVVHPTDDRHNGMHEGVVVHAMLTMETDGTRIVLEEEVVGMDQRIVVAKESNDEAFVVVYAREALLRDIAISLDERFVNIELLLAVGTRVEECLLAHHVIYDLRIDDLRFCDHG